MGVYVDDMQAPYGRMRMCHMLADTSEELLGMADRIGVDRKWIQDAGTVREHFDVALSKRDLAVRCGAKLVGPRDLALLMRQKRQALGSLSSPSHSEDRTGAQRPDPSERRAETVEQARTRLRLRVAALCQRANCDPQTWGSADSEIDALIAAVRSTPRAEDVQREEG